MHFAGVDEWEHGEGRDGAGVRKAVAGADHAIGEIMDAIHLAGIQDSTAIIITGDHGFTEAKQALFPNVWLAQQGLIKRTDSGMEWKARFQPTGNSAFLYLQDPNDQASLEEVKRLLNALPSAQKKMFRIIEKDELTKQGVDPAAVLAIDPAKGFAVYSSDQGEAVRDALQKGVHGGYPDNPDMYTGFIAGGAGLKTGEKLSQINLTDMAPLIARLLGISFNAPDGVLHNEVLKSQL